MKSKTIFKILSILMIVAFLLATVNISSYAALTSSSTGSITITGLEKGVTAYAYRIATVNVDDSTNSPETPMYSWVDEVETWLESSDYSDYVDIDVFAELDTTEDADELAEFYSAITNAIVAGSINITESGTQTTSGTADYPITTEESVTFSDMSMGLYVIYITGGYQVYSPVVAQVVPEYASGSWSVSSVSAVAKAEAVGISKTLDSDTTSVTSGDTLSYTITADVMTYDSSAVNKTYKITDIYGSGLSIDTSDITVYGVDAQGNETELTINTDYTISSGTDSDGNSYFTVNFVYDNISSYSSVKITYTATINLGAGLDYTNYATLTYSSDPYADDDNQVDIGGDDEEDDDEDTKVIIYLYGIEITTTDSSTGAAITSESTFQLYDEDGNLLYFYLEDGVYYLVSSDYTGATTDLKTTSGVLNIYGLSTGTYTLKQTSAPDGYVLNTTEKKLTITDDYDSDGNEGQDGIIDGDTDEILSVIFTNGEGYTLPTTGGIGIALFTIAGLVLIAYGIRLGTKKEKED